MFKGSEYAYYGMYLVGFAIMMIVNLRTHKKYELTKKTAVIFTLITYVAGVYGAMLMGDMYSKAIAEYNAGYSTVAIFGAVFFTPIFMMAVALLFGQPWRKIMDLLAPGIFIILACAKFGCFLSGCCPGRECSFGIYNPKFELTMFPSQLFESVTMLLVVGVCFFYAFRYKKCISGSVYPVTAAVYSVTRFGWEFMRYYEYEEMRHMMFGLSFWQFWCVVIIVLSCVWIILLKAPWFIKIEEKYDSFVLTQKEKRATKQKKQNPQNSNTHKKKKSKKKKNK